jgi:hypothetical protein
MTPIRRRQVAILVALALGLAPACTKTYVLPPETGTTPTPVPAPVVHTIEYRVLGTVPLAEITYGSAQEGTTTTETAVPWSASVKTSRPSLFVYLKASSAFNGTITAQIFVDGQFFREATNNFLGSSNVADASGTVVF